MLNICIFRILKSVAQFLKLWGYLMGLGRGRNEDLAHPTTLYLFTPGGKGSHYTGHNPTGVWDVCLHQDLPILPLEESWKGGEMPPRSLITFSLHVPATLSSSFLKCGPNGVHPAPRGGLSGTGVAGGLRPGLGSFVNLSLSLPRAQAARRGDLGPGQPREILEWSSSCVLTRHLSVLTLISTVKTRQPPRLFPEENVMNTDQSEWE